MQVIQFNANDMITTSVTNVNSNTGIGLGGAGHGNARTPDRHGIWD